MTQISTRKTYGISCARSYRTLRDGSFEGLFPRHFVSGYDQPVPPGKKPFAHRRASHQVSAYGLKFGLCFQVLHGAAEHLISHRCNPVLKPGLNPGSETYSHFVGAQSFRPGQPSESSLESGAFGSPRSIQPAAQNCFWAWNLHPKAWIKIVVVDDHSPRKSLTFGAASSLSQPVSRCPQSPFSSTTSA
jgi:hypothetical protein